MLGLIPSFLSLEIESQDMHAIDYYYGFRSLGAPITWRYSGPGVLPREGPGPGARRPAPDLPAGGLRAPNSAK